MRAYRLIYVQSVKRMKLCRNVFYVLVNFDACDSFESFKLIN